MVGSLYLCSLYGKHNEDNILITKKRCSSCKWYYKWSNNNHTNSGLCELFDARTDSGNICNKWAGRKYRRQKFDFDI